MINFAIPVVICECTVAVEQSGFPQEPDFKVALTRVPQKHEALYAESSKTGKKYRVEDVAHIPLTRDGENDMPSAKLLLIRVN